MKACRIAVLVVLSVVAAAIVQAASPRDEAHSLITVTSSPQAATLVAADRGVWTFVIEPHAGNTDSARKSIAAADVVRWGRWASPAAGHQIYLRDGSLLVANVQQIDDSSILAEPTSDKPASPHIV